MDNINVQWCIINDFWYISSAHPLPAAESMIFGASARSIAAFGTIPLSVVKTRYEVRKEHSFLNIFTLDLQSLQLSVAILHFCAGGL